MPRREPWLQRSSPSATRSCSAIDASTSATSRCVRSVGIPAFSVEGGEDLIGKPPGTGKKLFEDFNEHRYHQPSDEYKEDWDFSGMEQYARFGMLIGVNEIGRAHV